LAAQAGIPVVPYRAVRSLAEARAAARALGFPLFVKPARQGSSVGVSRAGKPADLAGAIREALRYDDKILLERAVPRAREIECAVLGDPALPAAHPLGLKASVCGEVVPKTEFYSYASKYLDLDGSARYVPARLSAAQARRVQELSLAAFRALDGYAMGRADFLMDSRSGRLYFNEINTIPGFTSASMYPNLWRASGVPAKRLIERLIRLAQRRAGTRAGLLTAPPQPASA
ncbi:MAG: ATP-grasp domain-containing protein, partial [Elusimicrobia bacterium]|nr:ATP-grasp domain-containing protein [Elusimicrobiota bacterium]